MLGQGMLPNNNVHWKNALLQMYTDYVINKTIYHA